MIDLGKELEILENRSYAYNAKILANNDVDGFYKRFIADDSTLSENMRLGFKALLFYYRFGNMNTCAFGYVACNSLLREYMYNHLKPSGEHTLKEAKEIVFEDIKRHIDKCNNDTYSFSPINTEVVILALDQSKGFNLGSVINYLARYEAFEGSKKGNKIDLLKAIHYILFDIHRREGF